MPIFYRFRDMRLTVLKFAFIRCF